MNRLYSLQLSQVSENNSMYSNETYKASNIKKKINLFQINKELVVTPFFHYFYYVSFYTYLKSLSALKPTSIEQYDKEATGCKYFEVIIQIARTYKFPIFAILLFCMFRS